MPADISSSSRPQWPPGAAMAQHFFHSLKPLSLEFLSCYQKVLCFQAYCHTTAGVAWGKEGKRDKDVKCFYEAEYHYINNFRKVPAEIMFLSILLIHIVSLR